MLLGLGRAHRNMLNRNLKIGLFVFGGATITLLRILLYEGSQRSPKLFHPPLLLFESFILFVLVNAVFFGLNVLKTLNAARHRRDADVREMLGPAAQGQITDEVLQRWCVAPYFVSLGILAASAIIFAFSFWTS